VDATEYLLECEMPVRGLRVAWSVDLGFAPVEPEIAQICARAAQVFATDLGCVVEQATPGFPDPVHSLQILWASGLAAALGSYLPQWGDQMDPGLVELIRSTEPLSATDYAAAVMERDALWDRVQSFFARYDLLLTPTMPTTAFAADEPIPTMVAGRRTSGFGYTPFTYPFNLTGQPAASVPVGFTDDGLPVGMQIVGRRHADRTVLAASAAFEAACPWIEHRPQL
jgi:aspartyl-tRNA(Asn)/glutamyl-tRNA(Gln) amidotransferase subunit A